MKTSTAANYGLTLNDTASLPSQQSHDAPNPVSESNPPLNGKHVGSTIADHVKLQISSISPVIVRLNAHTPGSIQLIDAITRRSLPTHSSVTLPVHVSVPLNTIGITPSYEIQSIITDAKRVSGISSSQQSTAIVGTDVVVVVLLGLLELGLELLTLVVELLDDPPPQHPQASNAARIADPPNVWLAITTPP